MNLLTSSLEGDLSKVKYFLEFFDIDQKDFYGNTALSLAVKKGHKDIAEHLLTQGANPNTKNHSWQSPLHHACLFGNLDCVELLLKHKAEVNSQDQSGTTCLMIASRLNFSNIVEALLDAGADPRIEDKYGKGAISRCKNLEIVTLIQRSDNRKSHKKRSKSALVYNRLFVTFDEDEWKNSKLGRKVCGIVAQKVIEVGNSLGAKNEAALRNEVAMALTDAREVVKVKIEQWSLAYMMQFRDNLNEIVCSLSQLRPQRIDLHDVWEKAKLQVIQANEKKHNTRIEARIKKKVKRKMQEFILQTKNEILGLCLVEIKKKFQRTFE